MAKQSEYISFLIRELTEMFLLSYIQFGVFCIFTETKIITSLAKVCAPYLTIIKSLEKLTPN